MFNFDSKSLRSGQFFPEKSLSFPICMHQFWDILRHKIIIAPLFYLVWTSKTSILLEAEVSMLHVGHPGKCDKAHVIITCQKLYIFHLYSGEM